MIAAVASLLAFVVVAALGVRSFRTWDALSIRNWTIGVAGGYLMYGQASGKGVIYPPSGHLSGPMQPHLWDMPGGILGFASKTMTFRTPFGVEKDVAVRIPLWFVLLLLLIAPAPWLVGRPANGPAFPVVTDAKQA